MIREENVFLYILKAREGNYQDIDLNTSILQLLEISAEIQSCSYTRPEESSSANEKAAQQQEEYKRRRHLEEVRVGGLVGEGQLLATPSAAALTFQDRSFSLNISTCRVC